MNTKEIEEAILKIVKEATKKGEGVIQSTLWQRLGIDNREGTRAVINLVRRGLIKREPVVHKGRKTYKLTYVTRKKMKLKLVVNLNPVMRIPCFTCRSLSRCSEGNFYNPQKCVMLTSFLRGEATKRRRE